MCLEIHSVVLLSASNDIDAIYVSNINPHDIIRILLPMCAEEMNTPCLIMISKLIGSVKSRRILRVLFDLGSNPSLIHRRVLLEEAHVTTPKNLNPNATLGGTV